MPSQIECPHRADASMPCVIAEGPVCYTSDANDQPVCAGCGSAPFQTGVEPGPEFGPPFDVKKPDPDK
jgi:hypothetical protein